MNKRIKRTNMIWLDLEMTGLDPDTDVILEIASIITDDQLESIAEGPDLVIHQPDQVLDSMNEWCKNQHAKSGLTQLVHASTISIQQAEEQTLDLVKQYFKEDEGVLCGNSVWQDKQFLRKYMPTLNNYLNYRIIDVSSIKELVKRWYPKSPYTDFKKHDAHRALPDIKESIKELQHYKTHFFIPTEFTVRPQES